MDSLVFKLSLRHYDQKSRKYFFQEQLKKKHSISKIVLTFQCLNKFCNSRPSASNFKSYSQSLQQLFLTVGQNNLVTKYHFEKGHKFEEIFFFKKEKLLLLSCLIST